MGFESSESTPTIDTKAEDLNKLEADFVGPEVSESDPNIAEAIDIITAKDATVEDIKNLVEKKDPSFIEKAYKGALKFVDRNAKMLTLLSLLAGATGAFAEGPHMSTGKYLDAQTIVMQGLNGKSPVERIKKDLIKSGFTQEEAAYMTAKIIHASSVDTATTVSDMGQIASAE